MAGIFSFLTAIVGRGEGHFTLTAEGEREHRPGSNERHGQEEAMALPMVECRPDRRSPPPSPFRWPATTNVETTISKPVISHPSIRRSPPGRSKTFIFKPASGQAPRTHSEQRSSPKSSPHSSPKRSPGSRTVARGSPDAAEPDRTPPPTRPSPKLPSPATGPIKPGKVKKPKAKAKESTSVTPRRSGRKPAPRKAPEGVILESWRKGTKRGPKAKRSPKDTSYVDKPHNESPAPSPVLPKPRKPAADPTSKPSREGSESPDLVDLAVNSWKRAADAVAALVAKEPESSSPPKRAKTTKAAENCTPSPAPAPKSVLKKRGRKPKSAHATTRAEAPVSSASARSSSTLHQPGQCIMLAGRRSPMVSPPIRRYVRIASPEPYVTSPTTQSFGNKYIIGGRRVPSHDKGAIMTPERKAELRRDREWAEFYQQELQAQGECEIQ